MGRKKVDHKARIITKFYEDRRLAHNALFHSRHQNETPEFHYEIIDRFHNPYERNVVEIAFRGSAKSTLAEEAIVLQACFREFKHCMIVGASYDKAAERLHAIRRQFEKNELLLEVFGDVRGQPWGDDKIELTTGITIQALGRGQAIRGTKNEDTRPDLILCDDIEDKNSMLTPEGVEKVQSWFFTELLPAGDEPNLRVRILCNDMGVNCLGNKLKAPNSGFDVHVYPWTYLDGEGKEQPIWPQRYPMEGIEKKKKQMFALGRGAEYNMEYMCRSESPEDKPFRKEMLRVEPLIRTWQAVYCCIDPARTTHKASAETGFACWSWIANRLVVWEAWGKQMLPDEIINSIFAANEEFNPTQFGADEVGLNEFLLQPIRQEQIKRGILIPIKPLHPPKSKTERIRALQPFAASRELILTKSLPDLEKQLLAFPYGQRDVIDALAYSLIMRPGQPVYEDFSNQNAIEELTIHQGYPVWLCCNAKANLLTACLVQQIDNSIHILRDWAREGDPADLFKDVHADASREAARAIRITMGPQHFNKFANFGLAQAARKMGEIHTGAPENQGREVLRQMLRSMSRGLPALMVSGKSRMILNGFSGGYCRQMTKTGTLADEAEDGVYKVSMEGLESFAGLLRGFTDDDANENINYARTGDGRRYISALKRRA